MRFTPNKPVVTTTPTVVVDGGLPPGRHRFRLQVENDRQERSALVELVVTVLPGIIVDPRDPIGGGGIIVDPRRGGGIT